MNTKLGYLLPEFPGQTHTFFWREIKALESKNIEVDIVSTKRPSSEIMSHTWSSEAESRTTYLFPPTTTLLIKAVLELFNSGLPAWLRCFKAIAQAKDVSLLGKLRLLLLMLAGAELAYLAKSKGWQHLHVHSCADGANIAMFAHLISAIPYSITLHGPLRDYGANQRQKWHFAKFATVITQKLYDEVADELQGCLPDKIAIAPMGVDTSVYRRNHNYSPWQKDTPCYIFSCGRLNPVKGHEDLIRSIPLLLNQGVDAYLTIAGDGEQGKNQYRQKLEEIIQTLGLERRVSLIGAVSEDVLLQYLEKAHVFSLASWEEPLGVAIMEAMSMQLPVVVTKAGGVGELVEDNISGIFVEPRSPERLAAAILQVNSDPQKAINIGEAARERVCKSFNSIRGAEVLIESI
ncbi:glycosyltransferase family 4 protein [Waterburya agarophytonicola K14]|uniref:Glycosyltransferase family 4 protein n=1 Tax=Waterburya agarophytonicola KI4 TaxID=2874699 RepID=A0A964BQ84_9CYAN|nr:exopolysaccharide biosynthesis GT4 family glycosyltransferase EpsE [Waterburya agarophytonicola]MCC0176146.1 glycosyltransferase family 4 protein [Waterburya agarophytonicola KI4]